MRRANNQDSLAVVLADEAQWQRRGHFFMVADGMGAHAAGELASQLATEGVPHNYLKLRDLPPPAALRRAIRKANQTIHSKGQSSGEFHGMGTTCSCLLLLPRAALAGHVGDSRVYRLRGSRLEQLTFDHSLVWEMAAASQMDAGDVPACIPKNVITRSLGPHQTVNIDLEGPFDTAPGDVFLLCSDGLTTVVDDQLLGAVLNTHSPQEAVQTLVDLANLRGGPDNISVIVVRIAEDVHPGPASVAPSPELRNRRGEVHPAIWLSIAASLAAVVWTAYAGHNLGLALSAVALGASATIALLQRFAPPTTPSEIAWGGPYGNGPYRYVESVLDDAAVAALRSVVDQLAELKDKGTFPVNGDAPIDWQPFETARLAASASTEPRQVIQHYSAAIRMLMVEVRRHRRGNHRDDDRVV
ncbi:MAG: protein phosphatase 2C domain-containing protein [Pirellulales bacterium]